MKRLPPWAFDKTSWTECSAVRFSKTVLEPESASARDDERHCVNFSITFDGCLFFSSADTIDEAVLSIAWGEPHRLAFRHEVRSQDANRSLRIYRSGERVKSIPLAVSTAHGSRLSRWSLFGRLGERGLNFVSRSLNCGRYNKKDPLTKPGQRLFGSSGGGGTPTGFLTGVGEQNHPETDLIPAISVQCSWPQLPPAK